MAKARVSIKLDRKGIGEIMNSGELGNVLRQEAEKVSSAAGGGYEIVVDKDRRTSRVISMVLDHEGKEYGTGALARALGSMEEPWQKK